MDFDPKDFVGPIMGMYEQYVLPFHKMCIFNEDGIKKNYRIDQLL